MKATGIVRRIDDLGRVVIPKEIRRTMRIREGDPLEIFTTRDGEVIFKKYSLIGGLEDFAAQFCDTLAHSSDFTAAITDRDSVIATAGPGNGSSSATTSPGRWNSLWRAAASTSEPKRTMPCLYVRAAPTLLPPPLLPSSVRGMCWAWCCSPPERGSFPARANISWRRLWRPFWGGTWRHEAKQQRDAQCVPLLFLRLPRRVLQPAMRAPLVPQVQ